MRYFLLLTFLLCSMTAKAYDVEYSDLSDYDKKQVTCLAQNIYFESATEPTNGKIAVGMVTLNRANSVKYPDSVCGVVHQKVKGICQFSWNCDKTFTSRKWKIMNSDLYKDIRELAIEIYMEYDSMKDVSHGATHFHTTRINPRWTDLKRTVRIGQHIFYRPKRA